MAHTLPAGDGESSSELVKELTHKLEQLQGLLDSSIGSELADQLLQLQQRQAQPQQHRRHRSASLDVASPSTSSSSSTGPSFPSSPLSTHIDHSSSPSFSALQSENDQLRARLEASEFERERANREVVELKRRLGMIQLDELEELDLAGGGGRLGTSGPSRDRSNSRGGGNSGWSSSTGGMNGIRIPGAGGSSFSPPSSFAAARQGQRTSSSFSSARGFYAQSRASSSINTTLTTPSSSYPVTLPPPTSPASSFGGASLYYSGSRAPPPSLGSASYRSNTSSNGGRLDFEDLTPSRRSYAEADEGEADGEDGGITPLSTSPGSRSGSLSRRTSFSLHGQAPPCAINSAKMRGTPNEVIKG